MNKVSQNLPTLQDVINEIGTLCESSQVKFDDAPHIIEILLPTICSYLNYWWYYGPSAKQINETKLSKKNQLENNQSIESEKSTNTQTSKPMPLPSPGALGAITDKFDG
jgi:hypothetical protein